VSPFTKGPWVFNFETRAIEQVAPNVTTAIALIEVGPNRVANGLVMSAAPELLELVKQALQLVPSEGTLQRAEWHAKAEAAVAKAEGHL
jgi:hypothetical protein